MSRDKFIVGLFAVVAVVAAIGFGLMFSRLGDDSCLSEGGGTGSCPTLADVNGNRYTVGVASAYVGLEPDLAPYARITRTNSPGSFSDKTTFTIGAIDPLAVLAAPARQASADDVGPYRLLFGPNSDAAWPALCDYLPEEMKQAERAVRRNDSHVGETRPTA